MRIRVITMLDVEIVSDEFIKSVKSIRGAVITANRMIRTYGFTLRGLDAIFVIALTYSNEIKYIDMVTRLTDGKAVRKKIYYDSLERRHCCCYEESGKN